MKTIPSLVIDHVSKAYRSSPPLIALHSISFQLDPGTFSLLEGPSGSGKTTLLGIAGGLEKPTAGRVWISGTEITAATIRRLTEIRRRHVGFIFQDFKLIEALTADQNVALAFRLRGYSIDESSTRSQGLLTRLGLRKRFNHYPSALSGGEKQRVAIARALAGTPTLLLADEPTANLDTDTGCEVVGLLRELTLEQPTAVLVASHNPRLAKHVDRILRLEDGIIVQEEFRQCL